MKGDEEDVKGKGNDGGGMESYFIVGSPTKFRHVGVVYFRHYLYFMKSP